MRELLPQPEAARRLAIRVRALRRLIARGDLPAVQVSPRCVRIPADGLEAFIQRRLMPARNM
jgi:excisionase family DNA binding protein